MQPVFQYNEEVHNAAKEDPFYAFLLASRVDEPGYAEFLQSPFRIRLSVEEHLNRVRSGAVNDDVAGPSLDIVKYLASDEFRANKLEGKDLIEVFMNLKNLVLADPVLAPYWNSGTKHDLNEHFDHVIAKYRAYH